MNDDQRRKCIFTGLPADFKMRVVSLDIDKHNWAKDIPCNKKYIQERGEKPLNELEFKLVELFYERELSLLRAANCDSRMDEIRALIDSGKTSEDKFLINPGEIRGTMKFKEVVSKTPTPEELEEEIIKRFEEHSVDEKLSEEVIKKFAVYDEPDGGLREEVLEEAYNTEIKPKKESMWE